MADGQQHTSSSAVVEQEPLTGLNIISDASTNGNTSRKSAALAEVDLNSVSNINSDASLNTESKSVPKKVSIADADEQASGVNENLEIALPEGIDNEDRLDDDTGGANMPVGVGEKKKKKKKPKSQRGLVGFKSIVMLNIC